MVAFYFYLFILFTVDVYLSDIRGVNYVVLRYMIRELNNLFNIPLSPGKGSSYSKMVSEVRNQEIYLLA